LWKYVDESKPAPDLSVSDKGKDGWEEKDQQAKVQIILAASDSVLPIVRHVKTSMEAWTKILSVYELNSLSQQVSLRRQLTNLRFNSMSDLYLVITTCVPEYWTQSGDCHPPPWKLQVEGGDDHHRLAIAVAFPHQGTSHHHITRSIFRVGVLEIRSFRVISGA
jgi:hypothetical protein